MSGSGDSHRLPAQPTAEIPSHLHGTDPARAAYMRSLAVLVLVLVGCSAPAAVEERELSTSNIEETEPALEVGASLTVRLSVDIRADLLPKAKVSPDGRVITYGKPASLSIEDGKVSATNEGLRCSVSGWRPEFEASDRYFPPVLPNPLALTVVRAAEGSTSLHTEPLDGTTWQLTCLKDGAEISAADLRTILGAASSVISD